MDMEHKILLTFVLILLASSILAACKEIMVQPEKTSKIAKFSSGEELLNAFENASKISGGGRFSLEMMGGDVMMKSIAVADSAAPQAAGSGRDFSETNVQVKGVDEADIIKTDGDYIYTIAQGNLVIAKAYPAGEAEILSTTKLGTFYPNELFIDKNRLLVFGTSSYRFETVKSQTQDSVEGGSTPQQGEQVGAAEPANAKGSRLLPLLWQLYDCKIV